MHAYTALPPSSDGAPTTLWTPAPKSKTCSTTSMTEPIPSSGDSVADLRSRSWRAIRFMNPHGRPAGLTR